MLDVKDLHFAFPDTRFHFNLTVDAGSLVAVIGPSGGGKSTLLHLIAGFEKPSQGEIIFDGNTITQTPPGQRPLTIIFQDNNLFPHLTVAENVGLALAPSLTLSSNQKDHVHQALRRVGLDDLATRKPGELSGGERQRAAIARALLRQKPLLLLDEAFAALGPALRADMLALIASLHHDQNLTTLMVTHNPADAHRIASHVAFLAAGQIKAYGQTQSLLSDSSHPELQAYLGEQGRSG